MADDDLLLPSDGEEQPARRRLQKRGSEASTSSALAVADDDDILLPSDGEEQPIRRRLRKRSTVANIPELPDDVLPALLRFVSLQAPGARSVCRSWALAFEAACAHLRLPLTMEYTRCIRERLDSKLVKCCGVTTTTIVGNWDLPTPRRAMDCIVMTFPNPHSQEGFVRTIPAEKLEKLGPINVPKVPSAKLSVHQPELIISDGDTLWVSDGSRCLINRCQHVQSPAYAQMAGEPLGPPERFFTPNDLRLEVQGTSDNFRGTRPECLALSQHDLYVGLRDATRPIVVLDKTSLVQTGVIGVGVVQYAAALAVVDDVLIVADGAGHRLHTFALDDASPHDRITTRLATLPAQVRSMVAAHGRLYVIGRCRTSLPTSPHNGILVLSRRLELLQAFRAPAFGNLVGLCAYGDRLLVTDCTGNQHCKAWPTRARDHIAHGTEGNQQFNEAADESDQYLHVVRVPPA